MGILLCLMLALTPRSSAFAKASPARPVLLVPVFSVAGGDPKISEIFTSRLRTALTRRGYRVLPRATVLPHPCSTQCLVDLGWATSASYVVAGRIASNDAGRWIITVRVFDGVDGAPKTATALTTLGLPRSEDAGDLAARLARRLDTDVSARNLDGQSAGPQRPLDVVVFTGAAGDDAAGRRLAALVRASTAAYGARSEHAPREPAVPEPAIPTCDSFRCILRLATVRGTTSTLVMRVRRTPQGTWRAQGRLLGMPDGLDLWPGATVEVESRDQLVTAADRIVSWLRGALEAARARLDAERQRKEILARINVHPQPESIRLLVLPFESDDPDAVRDFRWALAGLIPIDVLDGAETARVLPDATKGHDACRDTACALHLGRSAGVQLVVWVPPFGPKSAGRTVSGKLLHVASGLVLMEVHERVDRGLERAMALVARKLASVLPVPVYKPADPPIAPGGTQEDLLEALRDFPDPDRVHVLVFRFHTDANAASLQWKFDDPGNTVGAALANAMQTQLADRIAFKVLDYQEKISRLSVSAARSVTCRVRVDCLVELGRRSGVALVVVGEQAMHPNGNQFYRARLIAVRSAQVVAEAETEEPDIFAPMARIGRIGQDLAEVLARVHPRKLVEPPRPPSKPIGHEIPELNRIDVGYESLVQTFDRDLPGVGGAYEHLTGSGLSVRYGYQFQRRERVYATVHYGRLQIDHVRIDGALGSYSLAASGTMHQLGAGVAWMPQFEIATVQLGVESNLWSGTYRFDDPILTGGQGGQWGLRGYSVSFLGGAGIRIGTRCDAGATLTGSVIQPVTDDRAAAYNPDDSRRVGVVAYGAGVRAGCRW